MLPQGIGTGIRRIYIAHKRTLVYLSEDPGRTPPVWQWRIIPGLQPGIVDNGPVALGRSEQRSTEPDLSPPWYLEGKSLLTVREIQVIEEEINIQVIR